jgi:putative membrane protein
MTALSRTIELNLHEQMAETDKERGWKELSRHRVRRHVMPVDGFVF